MARKKQSPIQASSPTKVKQLPASELRIVLSVIALVSICFSSYLYYLYRNQNDSEKNLYLCLVGLAITVLTLFALRSEPQFSDETENAIKRQLGGSSIKETLVKLADLIYLKCELEKALDSKGGSTQNLVSLLKRKLREQLKVADGGPQEQLQVVNHDFLALQLLTREQLKVQGDEILKLRGEKAQADRDAAARFTALEHQLHEVFKDSVEKLAAREREFDKILWGSLTVKDKQHELVVTELNRVSAEQLADANAGFELELAEFQLRIQGLIATKQVSTNIVTEVATELLTRDLPSIVALEVQIKEVIKEVPIPDKAVIRRLEQANRDLQEANAITSRLRAEASTVEILRTQLSRRFLELETQYLALQGEYNQQQENAEAGAVSEAIIANAAATLDRVASRFWFFRSVSRMRDIFRAERSFDSVLLLQAQAELEEFLELITIGNPKDREALEDLIGSAIPDLVWEHYEACVKKVGSINSHYFFARALRQVMFYGNSYQTYLKATEEHNVPYLTRTHQSVFDSVESARTRAFSSGRKHKPM